MKNKTLIYAWILAAGSVLTAGCSSNTSSPQSPANTAPITTLAAFATIGSSTSFSIPSGLQYTNNHLWVVDYNNSSLSEWTTTGTNLGTITTYGATSLNKPWGVTSDPSGNIYLAGYHDANVHLYGPSGTYVTSVNSSVLASYTPDGAAVNSAGTTLLAVPSGGAGILAFPIITGTPPTYGTPVTYDLSGPGTLSNPYNLRLDPSGNIWVADPGTARLVELNASGVYQKSVSYTGGSAFSPADLAFDNNSNIYAADFNNNCIVVFTAAGSAVTTLGSSILSAPYGITTDGHGTFYVIDTGHTQVVAFH